MNEILSKYIQVIETLNPGDGYAVVDIELNHLAASKSVIDACGDDDFIGKKLKDLNSPYAQIAKDFRAVSQQFINSDATKTKLIMKNQINKDIIQLNEVHISKIFNQEHELLALVFIFFQLKNFTFFYEILQTNANLVYIFYSDDDERFQTEQNMFDSREMMIIWLLALGKTQKEIATIISDIEEKEHPKSTITTIITRKIYATLKVNSNSALIKKLAELRLLKYIPTKLTNYFQRTN